MNKEQAIALAETGWWKNKTARQICMFQLFEPLLCMPFGDFHKAVEGALNRPVWTHEFAGMDSLKKEFLGERAAPTMQEIVELIPEAKRIVLGAAR